ncbi:hypothetical protein [Nocardioides sp.]|uniref:hypothetical protein n=1 Tax=Nocardioides sp. TaxID=35761 RepID=UPI002D07129A|nr:hypothetical protein [Nocardioides sp.]HXH78172.1 hypothetical protein [Nocardioides sp.]
MASNGPSAPKPPKGLGQSGRALWAAVLGDFELTEHETVVLREACRTADSLDALQMLIEQEGHMSESSQGVRVHPALVELRQQRIALARLFAAMHIPTGEDQGRTQHRGVRGVYGIAR